MGTECAGAPVRDRRGSMLTAARDAGWAVRIDVGREVCVQVPVPPLDGLIDDPYYLGGRPPVLLVDVAGGARVIAHRQPRVRHRLTFADAPHKC